MVRLVDLDEHGCEANAPHGHSRKLQPPSWEDGNRPNPNFSLRVSVALSCYPIISQLASVVDLSTLHELSRTCRQIRANLLQYRDLLRQQTLHCDNENANPALQLGRALNASVEQWKAYARNGTKIERITSGKVGACARDLVGDCRHCGRVVCRNCIIKAPRHSVVKDRHRRLCRACMKSPLRELTQTEATTDNESDLSDLAFARNPCTCVESVWLCQPCGQSLRTADTTYLRGWAWRTRYSACGGIGAGLGEGNEGVECGRHGDCLDMREVEKEIEYEVDDPTDLNGGEAESAETDGRHWTGSGYYTHEIVGIGGTVKRKLVKMVPVGAIVKEYEDERMSGKFLGREQEAANRSWCSWCERVVPGKKDQYPQQASMNTLSAKSSSESSTSDR